MQISNNIKTLYPIENNNLDDTTIDLNSTSINIEQAETSNVRYTEDHEDISVVELSRVEQFRNCIRNRVIRKITISVCLLIANVCSIVVLVSLSLNLFSKKVSAYNSVNFSWIILGFVSSILMLIVVNCIALKECGIISKCLNKRRIQNPIVKELTNIQYKNIEQYQGNITEFCNKPSVIKLEELGSKELKDPIVYNKQLYSFKEFKKAIKASDGIVPHDKLIVDLTSIKKIKNDDKTIQDLV